MRDVEAALRVAGNPRFNISSDVFDGALAAIPYDAPDKLFAHLMIVTRPDVVVGLIADIKPHKDVTQWVNIGGFFPHSHPISPHRPLPQPILPLFLLSPYLS